KELGIPMILVGQITKDGLVAGPKLLEHMVDTVLSFSGDPRHAYRILRATKNRFGATDEVGVFEMKDEGLVGVPDASAVFYEGHAPSSGTAVTSVIDGARAFILEVQALVNASSYGTPVRRGSGFSTNRLQMLLAILERHGKVSFTGADVYVNIVGGYAIKEPAADLAILAALLSSKFDIALPEKTFFAGEVGLGGEIRPAPQKERRAKEAARLGFALPSSAIESISSLIAYIKSHSS
ncbi:MAG: DNA repair protein RadA, partial [Patescibacteria group bacterium]